MSIRSFSKMHGLGNDFIVLNALQQPFDWPRARICALADRHSGIGFDQLLIIEPAPDAAHDYAYRIYNADGSEVEHCGNGARCFVRYVHGQGLTARNPVRVKVKNGVIELAEQPDGRVRVNMGAPVFDLPSVPFDSAGLTPLAEGGWQVWPLALEQAGGRGAARMVSVAVLSMGNPHAVQVVAQADTAPVAEQGPLIETHPAFPRRVNAGFMQVLDRRQIRLRVWERGAGETLACGTGACAAVVAGRRLGLLDERVDVHARGGLLTIEWAGGERDAVFLTGPAQTVFHGEIDLPGAPQPPAR